MGLCLLYVVVVGVSICVLHFVLVFVFVVVAGYVFTIRIPITIHRADIMHLKRIDSDTRFIGHFFRGPSIVCCLSGFGGFIAMRRRAANSCDAASHGVFSITNGSCT